MIVNLSRKGVCVSKADKKDSKDQQESGSYRHLEPIGDILKSLQTPTTEGASSPTSNVPPDKTSGAESICPICDGALTVHPRLPDGKPDYSRTVPCPCIRAVWEEARKKRLRKLCEFPKKALSWNFDNFELLPGLEEAYDAALQLGDRRSPTQWLLLMGGTDRGKSHLLVSICHRWLDAGIPARYVYVPLLLDDLRRGFRGEGDSSFEAKFDFFLNVPLLALDDLGTENPTPWVQEKLDTIIDYRLMNELALVVTSNLPMDDLPFRIRSRLEREGRVVYIATDEYHQRPDRRK
jgi:DNA replication protein DnaC